VEEEGQKEHQSGRVRNDIRVIRQRHAQVRLEDMMPGHRLGLRQDFEMQLMSLK